MDFPLTPKNKRYFYTCMSRATIVKLRKLFVTGFSIYFLIYKLQDFMCPNYTNEVESYKTVSQVIEPEYVETLEKYFMDHAKYYHLTQVFSHDPARLKFRFMMLLRTHYLHFMAIEEAWDSDLIAEIKSNFTIYPNDKYRTDKLLLYHMQEMVCRELDYHASFVIEMGMTDLLRNYSAQALLSWYHWRGLILETDLVSLHTYANQPAHPTVMSQVSLCTTDQLAFHYYAVSRSAVKKYIRNRYQLVYRVPCFPLSYFTETYSQEHIEYFIVGPRCDLLPMLSTILKYHKMHFILVIFEKHIINSAAVKLVENNGYSVFYDSKNLSDHYTYMLFYKFLERPRQKELDMH